VGQFVRLQNFKDQPQLNGQLATVSECGVRITLQLLASDNQISGFAKSLEKYWRHAEDFSDHEKVLLQTFLDKHGAEEAEPQLAPCVQSSSAEYRPFAPEFHEKVKAQAKAVREALVRWNSRSNIDATWFKGLWSEVVALGELSPVVGSLLSTHGFKGKVEGSTAPRFEELRNAFAELANSAAPVHGTNRAMFEEAASWSWEEEVAQWTDQLPQTIREWARRFIAIPWLQDIVQSESMLTLSFPSRRKKRTQPFWSSSM